MYINKKVDLSKMNRIGVLTVAPDRISREDASVMLNSQDSLTKAFFERMRQCNYTHGQDCVLSMVHDDNLILAHFDNNAIFLLSENRVVSPQELVNAMANLQNSSTEMCSLLKRTNRSGYSDFYLGNLNINFVDLVLATGMPLDVVEQYLSGEANKKISVKTEYNAERGVFSHSHISQYGTNLINFFNRIIESNPDVRLLMSNVICRDYPVDLRQAMIDAIGFKRNSYGYHHGDGLTEKDLQESEKKPLFRSDEEFLKAFEKERQYQIRRRTVNNEAYQVYPAFKHVVELSGNTENVNEKYVMAWSEGDPDIGVLAITTALNNMIKAERREDDSSFLAPRVIPEVKDYMQAVTSRAHALSRAKQIVKVTEKEHISKS